MPKTLSVHPKYIQAVEQAWIHKSNGQEQELAKQLGRSLPIVINNLFLKGQPVNRLNFVQICQVLGLDWQEVAGLAGKELSLTSESSLNLPSKANPLNSGLNLEQETVDKALQDLVRTLCQMLGVITRKAGDLLGADRTSIFLIDQHQAQVGSLIAEDGKGGSLIIDVPLNKGIVGLAARSSNVINIPFDVYDDPRSEQAKKTDQKTGYRTYTILTWPLLNRRKEVVAVAQFINKLKSNSKPYDELSHKIDTKGFTSEDEFFLAKFAPSIMGLLGKCQVCHELAHKLQAKEQITRGGVVLGESELIAELRQREQQLQQSFAKLSSAASTRN